ncbi:hypothetical protein ACLBKU_11910 [Erythrobacter sp. NE805]|uniref:hypothetical protein n=1 Tax=Erythrobacter sp. NE805 TaxID=3389875 RepID=UPI00396B03EC
MAVLKAQDIDIAAEAGRIRLRIAGKTHYIAARDARSVSIALGNLALDTMAEADPDDFPAIHDIRLSFTKDGTPILGLVTSVADIAGILPHRLLEALASASAAALEHGPPKGSA